MEHVSTSELERDFAKYQDRALSQPLFVTREGQECLVMLAAEEYRRLKALDRVSCGMEELPPEVLADILTSRVPAEYECFNDELRG